MCSSCGNKREISESKEFYCELVVGVAAPSDPVGSILVEILHSVEGEDVEQGCSNLETNLPCLRLLSLSLSLSPTCVYILHALIVHIHYLLDILVLILIYAWGLFAHTCIQLREP